MRLFCSFLFAIAALTSRLWTYNLNTSNLILVFLLLALWRLAAETTTRDTRATALFLAVGASLWVPARLSEHHVVQLAEHVTWLAGTVGLLILDTRAPVSEELTTPDRPAKAAAVRGGR